MSTEEPGPHWLGVKEARGSEVRVTITDGALVACELEVKLTDVVLKTSDPANLLSVAVASFLFALADKLCKLLNKVPNLCHANIGERRADHTNDGGGKGARVVIGPRWAVQQELLRGRSGLGGLGRPLCGIDNF